MPIALASVIVQPAVTVTAGSAYASGEDVGGILTLTGAVNVTKGDGVLQSITVTDASNQKAALTVLLFAAQPVGGTYTDQTALALSTGDLGKCLGIVNVPAANYVSIGSKAVATVDGINLPVWTKGGTLYALVMTTGTPTYATVNDLGLTFGFQQN